jgi:hypothetical protein
LDYAANFDSDDRDMTSEKEEKTQRQIEGIQRATHLQPSTTQVNYQNNYLQTNAHKKTPTYNTG